MSRYHGNLTRFSRHLACPLMAPVRWSMIQGFTNVHAWPQAIHLNIIQTILYIYAKHVMIPGNKMLEGTLLVKGVTWAIIKWFISIWQASICSRYITIGRRLWSFGKFHKLRLTELWNVKRVTDKINITILCRWLYLLFKSDGNCEEEGKQMFQFKYILHACYRSNYTGKCNLIGNHVRYVARSAERVK